MSGSFGWLHDALGGSSGINVPGPPQWSIQFNNPLGTFAGDAHWIFAPPGTVNAGSFGTGGFIDSLHSAIGNVAGIDTNIEDPGDTTPGNPYTYLDPIVLSVGERFSGDLSPFPDGVFGQLLELGINHTGVASANVFGFKARTGLNSQSTGPIHQLWGADIRVEALGASAVDNVRAIAVQPRSTSSHLHTTMFGVYLTSFYGGSGGVTDYSAIDIEQTLSGASTIAAYKGIKIADVIGAGQTITGYSGLWAQAPSNSGTVTNAQGVRISDYSGIGGTTSFNFLSEGGPSINLMEGRLDIGKAGGVNTGNVNFIGKTSGIVKLSTQDAAGTWTLKLPTTAGTNTWFLQTDGSGNTTWAAGGAGGTPSLPLNSIQYDNAGAFGGAANASIVSGNIIIPVASNVLTSALQMQRLFNVNNIAFAIDNTGGFGDLDWFLGGAGNFTLGSSGVGGNFCEGPNAGGALTTGFWNMVEGTGALASCTTGQGNLAFGTRAQRFNVTGHDNVSIGTGSLQNSTAGNFNMAIGVGTLGGVIVAGGDANVAIGNTAGGALTGTSSQNLFIGASAGLNATTAFDQIVIGCNAGVAITTPTTCNVVIGTHAAQNLTSGILNNLIGFEVAQNMSTGQFNVCIGRHTGNTITTGTQNICIGEQCDVPTAAGAGQISIGNMIYGTGCTNVGGTPSTGKIGIGLVAPAFTLDVLGSIGQKEAAFLIHTSVALTAGSTANVPTLLSGPVTGDPTKWIAIDDNGTTRYVPSW